MTNPLKIKLCRKGLHEFVGNKCKECAKAYDAVWRSLNADKIKSQKADWHAKNLNRINSLDADSKEAYFQKRKAKDAAWQSANPGRAKANTLNWRAANPDRVKATEAAWRLANKDACRIIGHNRRARKIMNGGKLSKGLGDKLFKLQKGKCACCKKPLGDGYQMDHIMPLVKGGSNSDDNMQLLTATCNRQKHAKDPIEFMQSRGFLL